jgi:hypothetical protein
MATATQRAPLSERQLDKRLEKCPGLDAEDVQEAHQGERVVLFNLSHLNRGGMDYDGRRYNAEPGKRVEVTQRKALELLEVKVHFHGTDGDRGRMGAAFEVYDAKKHDAKKG